MKKYQLLLVLIALLFCAGCMHSYKFTVIDSETSMPIDDTIIVAYKGEESDFAQTSDGIYPQQCRSVSASDGEFRLSIDDDPDSYPYCYWLYVYAEGYDEYKAFYTSSGGASFDHIRFLAEKTHGISFPRSRHVTIELNPIGNSQYRLIEKLEFFLDWLNFGHFDPPLQDGRVISQLFEKIRMDIALLDDDDTIDELSLRTTDLEQKMRSINDH